MRQYIKKVIAIVFLLLSVNVNALSLYDDAIERGISETCSSYLGQIEKSYNLNGLNITIANPESPTLFPSLHISSQQNIDGSSTFSATLTPDEEYCYLSTVLVTFINNKTCGEISQLKLEANPGFQASNSDDGRFTVISPLNNINNYTLILTTTTENSCTMTESQMQWPGR